jgi:phospholipid/cholesterol/gamma-HCH transport system substrate-binding protein
MALFRRTKDPERRVLRKDRTGLSPFKVGLFVLILIVIITYLGFTKHIPFTHDFRFSAVFESATSIRVDSPVRIAGINVGKVTGVERYKDADAAVVEMQIQDQGLPIHRDATAKIRPRIFLEGNFFVDLKPGTPESPTLDDDDAPIPVTQTATPVQLDEILTALQSNARHDLQVVIDELGGALSDPPTAEQDADNDPDVQGKTAAQAFNQTYDYAAGAEQGVAQVNQALLGTEPGDLTKLVSGLQRTAAGLGRNEEQLKDLITNFNTTLAAFADESGNLQETIALLPPVLETANATFDALNAAFPPTRAFSLELIPGVEATPATIDAAYPWIAQTQALVQPDELGGLTNDLSATIPDLAKLTDETTNLLPKVDLVNRCVLDIVLPTGDVVIQDGPLTTGVENYKEFWWTLVGLSGESQNFDGNGQYVRFQTGGGTQLVSTGTSSLSGNELFGNAVERPLGTRPKYPGKRPPYNSDVPCYQNDPPNLNGPAAETGPADQVVGENNGTLNAGGTALFKSRDERSPLDKQRGIPPKKGLAEKLAERLNPWRGDAKDDEEPKSVKVTDVTTAKATKPIDKDDAAEAKR